MNKKLTYKNSGVDIKKANLFKEKLKAMLPAKIGGFGGLFEFDKNKYEDPVLVSSTDGVGTKLMIAQAVNKHDTIGIDLVAMNVNDILCTGAKPLFFVDYIACGKLEQRVLLDVIKGINEGCRQAGCVLVGGETAEMPGMYKKNEYDLAGFVVGVVEKERIIDGSKISAGDKVIGLESNGLHSNGFSLVRKVFSEKELKKYSVELLKPTRIYVKPILNLLRWTIKGIAHITGGAFYDKITRILPQDVNVEIKKSSWKIPQIFNIIQEKGNITEREMFHTLNMGVGLVLVVSPEAVDTTISTLSELGIKSWLIGEVVKGKKEVKII